MLDSWCVTMLYSMFIRQDLPYTRDLKRGQMTSDKGCCSYFALSCALWTSLRVNYLSTIALWAIQIECYIARLKFKYTNMFVVVIIHTIHIRNTLANTNFNLGCVYLRSKNSTISIYVNLFLCLEFYSKI